MLSQGVFIVRDADMMACRLTEPVILLSSTRLRFMRVDIDTGGMDLDTLLC